MTPVFRFLTKTRVEIIVNLVIDREKDVGLVILHKTDDDNLVSNK
jgi:hypothetical protein